MSGTSETKLQFELYNTNHNQPISANGRITFHNDGDNYEGSVDLDEPLKLENAGVHGPRISPCGDMEVIQFTGVSRASRFKMTLVKNPYEPKVSYGGSAYIGTGKYNVTAILATPPPEAD